MSAEPFLVEEGWNQCWIVKNLGRPNYRLLGYENGTVRFEHRCDRGERGVVICAPALQLDGGGHQIDKNTVTVTPSILCPDCGTHGSVTNGRWADA